jgi:formate dehydrogenase maturation protein FdhE
MASEDDGDSITDEASDPNSEADHRRRCPECRGRKMLPGMVRTEGKGMGSRYGPCPTCDGLGYVTGEAD